ncbi:MAG: hypothetical protein O3B13_22465 [Planctomycetota bacterium]|nr:hypothetical protein [Planctomycetota bacterium]MDA1165873.1 hypothetical protein [Planctomycetota bacterium]
MTDQVDWLPELVTLADCDGKWDAYLATIYEHFCDDFVRSKPAYTKKRFALKRHPLFDGKEATFWHLISEGSVEDERTPNLRRCERIRWPRPMIEAIHSGNVCVWRNVRKHNERIVIAAGDFSYVVILDDREEFVLLWTAYFVERNHQRQKLAKEYEAWKKKSGNS